MAAEFPALFDAHYPRVYRYLDRLTGEPELAADLAQDTFIRLFERGTLPDAPAAWLITVATNLFRNSRNQRNRRRRLLTPERAGFSLGDPAPSPASGAEEDEHARVRQALAALPQRERQLLLLRAEGYRYRELADALDLEEASIGTLLARAKRAFRAAYEGDVHAPRA